MGEMKNLTSFTKYEVIKRAARNKNLEYSLHEENDKANKKVIIFCKQNDLSDDFF